MRHVLVVALLGALVALPALGYAQSDSTLPVSGTVSSSTGTLNGTTTIGGVTGTVTSSGGNWTMTVGGVTFASGTYSCSGGGCTYTGTIAGSTTSFSFTTNKTAGTITNATGFSTHGGWVSAVAQWAGGNRAALAAAGLNAGQVVSGAAKIEGSLASGGRGGADGGHGGDHGKP